MRAFAICLCAVYLAIPLASFGQLYKCVDASGKTSYQQGPCSGDRAAGKLELQDQVTGKTFGAAPRGPYGGVTEKEFDSILVQARKNGERGDCAGGIPLMKLTKEQTDRVVKACAEGGKGYWQEQQTADARAQQVGPPRIGMKAAEVITGTWGKPETINKTTTAGGVREQWVYRGLSRYVYVENDIVVAIQE